VRQTRSEIESALRKLLWEARETGIVWQYSGRHSVGGKMIKLIHPRYAEETPDETILIADYEGDVIEVDRAGNIVWSYSIPHPETAHRLDNGNTLIASPSKIIEVNHAKTTVWELSGSFSDAVKIGDYIIATTGDTLKKIDYATKGTIWSKTISGAFLRQIFVYEAQHLNVKPSFATNKDGDYLIGDANGALYEIRDSDQTIVWQYGNREKRHAYNRLAWCAGACVGWSDWNAALMFITDSEFGRVFAINRDKHTVWQYGWSHGFYLTQFIKRPSPLLNTPDSVRFTKRGNLLISDSGGSKVIEIVFKEYNLQREWAELFSAYSIRDTATHDSLVAETGWYPWSRVYITLNNWHDQPLSVTVQGDVSRATFTAPFDITTIDLTARQIYHVDDPPPFLRVRASASIAPTSGAFTAIVHMFK